MASVENRDFKELHSLSQCCICLTPYTDPRMLPCIHSACLKCFEELQAKNSKRPGDTVLCPICRTSFTIPPEGMIGLQKNFFIENLMEITQTLTAKATPVLCRMCKAVDEEEDENEATVTCLECRENYCKRCCGVHKIIRCAQHHRFVDLNSEVNDEEIRELLPPRNCPEHPRRFLDFYCADCKTVICVTCFVERHRLHDCKDIATVDGDFRKKLEDNADKMLCRIAQMETKRCNLDKRKANISEQTSEIENTIRLTNQQLKALIDQHTEIAFTELSSLKRRLFKELEIEIEEIEGMITTMQSLESYCTEVRCKGSPAELCNCVDSLVERATDLDGECSEASNVPLCMVEIKFNATDQEVLMQNINNIIGELEEISKRTKRYAVVIGQDDGDSVSVCVDRINLLRAEDVSSVEQKPTAWHQEIAAAAFDRNSIYVTGIGNNNDEIWKFDALSSNWKKCASLVKGRRRHSVAFLDQFLYICGGYVQSENSTLDDVEAYDATNDSCSSVGKLVHSVQNSGNCVPFNSSLYIFGGTDVNYNPLCHVQVYDTKLNTCTLLSHPLPVACSHMRAVLVEKTVFLLGYETCFLCDFETETWQERHQFKTEVVHFGMIIENGQIFVIGGGKDITYADGKVTWICRDDIRYIPVKNFIEDRSTEWRHHAKLPNSLLIYACGSIDIEL